MLLFSSKWGENVGAGETDQNMGKSRAEKHQANELCGFTGRIWMTEN